MKKIISISTLIIALSGLLIGGCATTQVAEKEVNKNSDLVTQLFDQGYQKVPKAPLISKDNGFWVNPRPIPHFEDTKKTLPAILLKDYVINYPGDATLTEIIANMSSSHGLVFEVSQDVYDPNGGIASIVSGGAGGGAAGGGSVINPVIKNMSFSGPMDEMLNVLTAKLNLSWKWNGRAVEIYRYESKTYYLSALAGKTSTSLNINTSSSSGASGGGGGGGGGGGSSQTGSSGQTLSTTFNQTTWDDAINYIRSMMSPRGRVSVMESSGLILVRDTPSVLHNVDRAVAQLNTMLSRQISINVDVYSVSLNDTDNLALDWNLIWSSLSSKYNFGYTTSGANTSGQTNPISIGISSGSLAGSSLAMTALSSISKASLISNTQLVTLNGRVAPVLIAREFGYVQSTSTTINNGVSQTTINPGTITSGLGMQLLPQIQSNGNILLQTAISISDLESLDSFTTSGSTIQIPKRALRNIVQAAAIKSGQTLILSGFQNIASKIDNKGVGSANNIFFGGSQGAENRKDRLVFLITPFLLD